MEGSTWTLVLLLGALVLVTADVAETDHKDHSNHGNAHDAKGHGDVTDDKTSGKVFAHGDQKWAYNIEPDRLGPAKWGTLFPEECGSVKKRQSPINIVTSETKYSEMLDDIDIIDPEVKEETPEVETVEESKAETGTVQPVKTELKIQPTTKVEGETKTKDGQVVDHSNHEGMMADEGATEQEVADGKEADEGEGAEDGKEAKEVAAESAAPSDSGMYLFNNGHTVQVNVVRPIYVMGGGLGDQYKVAQFHFHWGNGSVGSEHRIDDNMFMLEMHMVTYNSERYANLYEAVGKENGIAVLSTLFKKGKHNKHLNNVVNNLKNLHAPEHGKKHMLPIDWVDVRAVLPARTDRYYRYQGSLTTPTCDEAVKWTVFADHPTICPHQMKQFYKLPEGYYADGTPVPLHNNWRPPQPLNERTVFSSFPPGSEQLVEYAIKGEYDEDPTGVASSAVLSGTIIAMVILYVAALGDIL